MTQTDATPSAPMLVNCTAYGGGKARAISLDDISEVLKEPDSFVWVGLYEPDEPLLDKLQEEFNLHPLAIEDAHCAHRAGSRERRGIPEFFGKVRVQNPANDFCAVTSGSLPRGSAPVRVSRRRGSSLREGDGRWPVHHPERRRPRSRFRSAAGRVGRSFTSPESPKMGSGESGRTRQRLCPAGRPAARNERR